MASMDEPTKREQMAALIEKKRKCDKVAIEIIHRLIEPSVERNYFLDKAGLIAPHHLDDIVEERKLSGICGWVLCDEKLGTAPKQQYKITNNKVLDITERKNFCSAKCYGISIHFKAQMITSPLWLRDEEPVPVFNILEPTDSKQELHGLKLSFYPEFGEDLKPSDSSDSDDDDVV